MGLIIILSLILMFPILYIKLFEPIIYHLYIKKNNIRNRQYLCDIRNRLGYRYFEMSLNTVRQRKPKLYIYILFSIGLFLFTIGI